MNEREMYDVFYEHVYKTAFFIVKDVELSKDITQETFIKIFKSVHKLKEKKKIKSWITTITIRTSYDELKKLKKFSYYSEEVLKNIENKNILTPEEVLDKREFNETLERLNIEFKEILILKYIEKLSEKEIAELLDIKLGTVKSRIHRAKEKLSFHYNKGGATDE